MKLNNRANRLGALTFWFVAITLYTQGLHGPFLLDDFPQLKPIINAFAGGEALQKVIFENLFSHSGPLGRPLSMLSFIGNAALFGDSPWTWKFVNLLVHIFNAMSIYLFAREIGWLTKIQSSRADAFALLLALIWLAHPTHVSTVLYTVQRMTELATTFTLGALILYVRFRLQLNNNSIATNTMYVFGIIFSIIAATLSKEIGALTLLYLFIIEFTLFESSAGDKGYLRAKLVRRTLALITIAAIFGSIYFAAHFITERYPIRTFTLIERLLTELRVMVSYIGQTLLPAEAKFGFFHDDRSISTSLTSPPTTLLSSLLLVSLLAAGFYLRRKVPIASVGIFLFFSSHLLESTIFPLELMYEHRNYFGSLGLILAALALFSELIKHDRAYVLVCVLVLCYLSVMTWTMNRSWTSSDSLYPYLYSIHPNSPRLAATFSASYADAGQYDKALSFLDRMDSFGAALQKSTILCRKDKSLSEFFMNELLSKTEGPISTYEVSGLIEISNLVLDKDCTVPVDKVIDVLTRSTLKPVFDSRSLQKIHLYIGHLYRMNKKQGEAFAALESSFNADKTNPIPLFLASEWALEDRNLGKSTSYLHQAKQVAQNSYIDYSDFILRIEQKHREVR